MKNYNKKIYFVNHANNIVKTLDDLYKNNNLWNFLAFINHNEMVYWGSPLVWLLSPDDKEPNIFRSYIGGPKLTLLDITVYFDDGTNVEYKRKYKKTYTTYLKNLFEYFFGKNNDYNVNDVFDVEAKIANAFACNIIKPKKEESNYNRVNNKEALEEFQFDWKEFSKELGFKTTPDFFVTADLNYLLCIVQLLLKEWNTPQWKTYWIYIYIGICSVIALFSWFNTSIWYVDSNIVNSANVAVNIYNSSFFK
jgi:predicted metalloendopeptidase